MYCDEKLEETQGNSPRPESHKNYQIISLDGPLSLSISA